MSEHKMVTEREAVQRERAAFAKGARQAHDDQYRARLHQKDSGMYRYDFREGMTTAHDDALRVVMRAGAAEEAAQRQYAMQKVTRVRVVDDGNGFEWKYDDGEILYRRTEAGYPWRIPASGNIVVTTSRVTLWADLLANPTEEVESDADA